MFVSVPRGVLITGNRAWTRDDVAAALGGNADVTGRCVDELIAKGVCRVRPDGALYSKRMVEDEEERVAGALRVARFRMKRKCNGRVTPSRGDEDVTENETPQKPKPRNPLFDALARACGSEPSQLTNGAARTVGVALAEIRAVFPNVTPDEIGRRADAYRRLMPTATLTESALAKHWARCVPGSTTHPKAADPYVEPAGWRDTLREIYRNVDRERVDDLCRTEWADLSLNVRNDIVKNIKS